MATTFVLKIKYADTLRRITVQASPSTNGPDLSYSQLEDIIRQTFKLPVSLELVITYTDMENDVVTMAGDQDLQDACVNQGLNPLRLQVTTVASSAAAPAPPSASPVDDQSILSSKAPNVSAAPAPAPTLAAAAAQKEQPVFHYGVLCDMCNMTPIAGPRYKSLKEHNYDLCQACFEEHGRAEDYDRIGRPLIRPRHLHPSMFGGPMMGCPANLMHPGGRPACSTRGHHHGGPGGPYGGKPETCAQVTMFGSGGWIWRKVG